MKRRRHPAHNDNLAKHLPLLHQAEAQMRVRHSNCLLVECNDVNISSSPNFNVLPFLHTLISIVTGYWNVISSNET